MRVPVNLRFLQLDDAVKSWLQFESKDKVSTFRAKQRKTASEELHFKGFRHAVPFNSWSRYTFGSWSQNNFYFYDWSYLSIRYLQPIQ